MAEIEERKAHMERLRGIGQLTKAVEGRLNGEISQVCHAHGLLELQQPGSHDGCRESDNWR